ncbi:hypothetical protein H4R35_002169 [Dimargaris xerosporica]|nr:hypothetical protein H4R35_002169 [Dimargaris xerosporica]
MKLITSTILAVLLVTAVTAQSSTVDLTSMSGYTDKQLKCVNDPVCQTDPRSCLTCLGVSSEDVDTAVDCMKACPQPTSLADTGPFMECATKCTSDMFSKIDSNSTTSTSSSSNTTGGNGSASYIAKNGSIAAIATLPMALAVALPTAVLAAL